MRTTEHFLKFHSKFKIIDSKSFVHTEQEEFIYCFVFRTVLYIYTNRSFLKVSL